MLEQMLKGTADFEPCIGIKIPARPPTRRSESSGVTLLKVTVLNAEK